MFYNNGALASDQNKNSDLQVVSADELEDGVVLEVQDMRSSLKKHHINNKDLNVMSDEEGRGALSTGLNKVSSNPVSVKSRGNPQKSNLGELPTSNT